jgi:uncharacterized protein YjbI with pentapeptide repeats
MGTPVRDQLLSGTAVQFQPDEPEPARTIEAAWIREAVVAPVRVDVRNAVITGTLDLKYVTLHEELSLVDCRFKELAVISYTDFERNLTLSGSVFEQGATFQSSTAKYDVILLGTSFLAGDAIFTDLHVKGALLADRLRVGKDVVEVNFNRTRIDRTAYFLECSFEGSASFRGACFGDQAAFQGATFQSVSFSGAKIGKSAFFRAEPMNNITRGALFEGRADFSDALIGSNAEFQGAVFKSIVRLNSTTIGNHILFRGEPEQSVSATVCEGEVDFGDARIGGTADFGGSVFRKRATFERAKVGSGMSFNGGHRNDSPAAIFEGEAIFRRAQISGQTNFRGVRFKEYANFGSAEFAGGAIFSSEPEGRRDAATFERGATFASARFGGQADFRGTVFRQNVSFNLVTIDGGAFFRNEPQQQLDGATFGGEADFVGVRIEGDADFRGAVFKDAVTFTGATINGRTMFDGNPAQSSPAATFEGNVEFVGAQLVGDAQFTGVLFKREGRFSGAILSNGASFADAVFEGNTNFSAACFRRKAEFKNAKFLSGVTFNVANFEGEAFFDDAVFKGAVETDFRGARFRGVVDFQTAVFEGDCDFYSVQCDSLARFEQVTFQKSAGFRGASFKTLDFSEDGEQFYGDVDLRGCTYEHIQVGWELLMKRLEPYDRQPYTQLEKVLRAMGQGHAADNVYLMRQHRERGLILMRGELGTWAFSMLYWALGNYGVRPLRLIAFAAALLWAGTTIFQSPGAVSAKDRFGAVSSKPIQLTRWDAFGVSLHQFLPVDVPIGAAWVPSEKEITIKTPPLDLRPTTFATFFLRLAGWVLVPLGVAAVTGLLRVKP